MNINKHNKEGKKHGMWKCYFRFKNNVSFKETYIDGKLNGPFESYQPDGNILIKGHYINDKRYGIWEHYQEHNQLICIKFYI